MNPTTPQNTTPQPQEPQDNFENPITAAPQQNPVDAQQTPPAATPVETPVMPTDPVTPLDITEAPQAPEMTQTPPAPAPTEPAGPTGETLGNAAAPQNTTSPVDSPADMPFTPQSEPMETPTSPEPQQYIPPVEPAEGTPSVGMNNQQSDMTTPQNTVQPSQPIDGMHPVPEAPKKGNWFTRLFGGK